jgi:hypothetical protein
MNKRAIQIICLICLIVIPTCVFVGYDGAYKGQIVDAETKTPVEGVVILGVWHKVAIGPGGGSHKFYEARETLSRKDGNFEIDGLGLVWRLTTDSINVVIFKSGYQYIGTKTWESFKSSTYGRVKWEGGRAIIPLKKLTMEERRKKPADKELIPDIKQRLLIKELNKEYKELGIAIYPEVK